MTTKIVDVSNQKTADDLPPMTKVVHVDYLDPLGKRHTGEFTIKKLSVGGIRQVGVRRAQLNGGMPADSLDANVASMNSMCAHLEFALIKSPEWWEPDDFINGDIILDVFEEVMSFEDQFREAARKRKEAASGITSHSTVEAAGPGAPPAAVVGEEVSPTSDFQ